MIKQDVVVEKGEYLLEMEFNGLWTIRIYTFMQKDCPYLNIYNRWERERARKREREREREKRERYLKLIYWAVRVLYFSARPTMTREIRLQWSSPRTVTHTYCRAFRSGSVTTCFYDLSLLRLWFDIQPSACKSNCLTDCPTAAVELQVE